MSSGDENELDKTLEISNPTAKDEKDGQTSRKWTKIDYYDEESSPKKLPSEEECCQRMSPNEGCCDKPLNNENSSFKEGFPRKDSTDNSEECSSRSTFNEECCAKHSTTNSTFEEEKCSPRKDCTTTGEEYCSGERGKRNCGAGQFANKEYVSEEDSSIITTVSTDRSEDNETTDPGNANTPRKDGKFHIHSASGREDLNISPELYTCISNIMSDEAALLKESQDSYKMNILVIHLKQFIAGITPFDIPNIAASTITSPELCQASLVEAEQEDLSQGNADGSDSNTKTSNVDSAIYSEESSSEDEQKG